MAIASLSYEGFQMSLFQGYRGWRCHSVGRSMRAAMVVILWYVVNVKLALKLHLKGRSTVSV